MPESFHTFVAGILLHLACTTRSAQRHMQTSASTKGSSEPGQLLHSCEVLASHISLDGVQPRDTGTPWWSLPVLWWRSS